MPFTSPILWQDNTHPHIYIYMCVFSELNFSSHQEGHTRTTKFGGLRSNLVEISPQMPSLVVCLRPPRFGNLCAERMWHLLRVFCFLFYSMFFHALVSGTSQDGTQRDGLRAHFLHAGREKTHATNVVVWKMSWPRLHLHRRIARCFFFFRTVSIVEIKIHSLDVFCLCRGGLCGILHVLYTRCALAWSPRFRGDVANPRFFLWLWRTSCFALPHPYPAAISASYPRSGDKRWK